MSVNDPIADMLTRIRNGVMTSQSVVAMPHSKIKAEIARILKEEGFVEGYEVVEGDKPGTKTLRVKIKYVGERRERTAVITGLERVSRPGRRVYTQIHDIPSVLAGMRNEKKTRPKGVMTGQRARQLGIGGEILCKVW